MQATVNNIFEDTSVTQDSVDKAIQDAIATSSGLLSQATFRSKHWLFINDISESRAT